MSAPPAAAPSVAALLAEEPAAEPSKPEAAPSVAALLAENKRLREELAAERAVLVHDVENDTSELVVPQSAPNKPRKRKASADSADPSPLKRLALVKKERADAEEALEEKDELCGR